ncbi:MAG: zf-TFIIB domain-containing protein [Chloroflexi bacterium]|uniref:Zf-TFIIB domain-containing protein n=1 Tax=Candidatus Chlorohelix allophototropha TaxID=3003348 RepID=A0A8T7M6M9_9CHLR|nr:zf-TFIIB domain-containing protein [Chloroflexota bacterium]WJW69601.1 zf-TFIIB domain-containing protein [Chloroflexota bacterium L227-S17]
MRCPDCEVDLLLAERIGVEINYCPKCRGVWLERGKLDKIIENSVPAVAQGQRAPQNPAYPPYQQPQYDPNQQYRNRDHDEDDDHDDRYEQDGNKGKKHKRGGFLGDFLDF